MHFPLRNPDGLHYDGFLTRDRNAKKWTVDRLRSIRAQQALNVSYLMIACSWPHTILSHEVDFDLCVPGLSRQFQWGCAICNENNAEQWYSRGVLLCSDQVPPATCKVGSWREEVYNVNKNCSENYAKNGLFVGIFDAISFRCICWSEKGSNVNGRDKCCMICWENSSWQGKEALVMRESGRMRVNRMSAGPRLQNHFICDGKVHASTTVRQREKLLN